MFAQCKNEKRISYVNDRYWADDSVYLTKGKKYNIYGIFSICDMRYYLICNDIYTDSTMTPILYNSNLFEEPNGYLSNCMTENLLRKDICYIDNFKNDVCFPECFYMPNFLLNLYLKNDMCLQIFNFYKNLIDTDNEYK